MARKAKVVSATVKTQVAEKIRNKGKTVTAEKIEQSRQFKTRAYNICKCCGRSRGYMRRFQICRICFRTFARSGMINGVAKSSW